MNETRKVPVKTSRARRVLAAAFWSAAALLPAGCASFTDLSKEPMPYIEPGYSNRLFNGDENTRAGRAYYIQGDFGLAEQAYRRAVEATPQNGEAWLGLASSYDRLNRYDLADHAYANARRLGGSGVALLNNEGYSMMLRGNTRQARVLLLRARRLDPGNVVVANNLAVLDSGQGYFMGIAP
jgi:Flp pilus assembly protein TadD